ncbi:hypothetical protein KC725_04565 [Candidatus Peregrinibacteria bacterium]|nr:hypothetical protein [Candidatus Peregrinibacteria bacterium]
MKFTKLLILCCAIASLTGCTQWFQSNNDTAQKNTYVVNSCNFATKDLTCTTEPGNCTLNIEPSDFCGQFVSCSDTGEIIKHSLYDKCVDCTTGFSYLENGTMSEECTKTFPEFSDWWGGGGGSTSNNSA